MNGDIYPGEAIRWLAAEAKECHEKDAHEAFCLLLPALMKILEYKPMDVVEQRAFRYAMHQHLIEGVNQPA